GEITARRPDVEGSALAASASSAPIAPLAGLLEEALDHARLEGEERRQQAVVLAVLLAPAAPLGELVQPGGLDGFFRRLVRLHALFEDDAERAQLDAEALRMAGETRDRIALRRRDQIRDAMAFLRLRSAGRLERARELLREDDGVGIEIALL